MNEAPPRRRQEDRSALSDRLMIEAAIALLVESGIAGTTLAAIGERAGYSRGLATHRFGTKAKLLAHVHDSAAADWIRRVQEAVGDHSGIDALERVIDGLYGFIAEEPDEIRAMYLLRYASIDPGSDYRANVAKVHKAQRRDVQRWIETGKAEGSIHVDVDVEVAAELFVAMADGLVYRWLVNPKLPVRKLHDRWRDTILRTLSAAHRPR